MSVDRKISMFSKKGSMIHTLHVKKRNQFLSIFKYSIAWIAYVLIGSYLFILLERETYGYKTEIQLWKELKDSLQQNFTLLPFEEFSKKLYQLCPRRVLAEALDDFYHDLNYNKSGTILTTNLTAEWIEKIESMCENFLFVLKNETRNSQLTTVDSIYYTMTLVTTIGFGNLSPTTDAGKMFCIPYALVGVPLTCILLAKCSDLHSNRILKFYQTARKRFRKHPHFVLWTVTWLFVILGCFVFMFLPSLVFVKIEGWSLTDSFYFSFITLTTIGFGDYIAGYNKSHYLYSELYKMMLVVWIMLALGYWIFLLNFLQKAIKSNAKTFRRTFKHKNITRQAEFLKQLLSKMRQSNDEENDENNYNERLHMMALLVESISIQKSSSKLPKIPSRASVPGSFSVGQYGNKRKSSYSSSLIANASCSRIKSVASKLHMIEENNQEAEQEHETLIQNLPSLGNLPLNMNDFLDIKITTKNKNITELIKHLGTQGFCFKSDEVKEILDEQHKNTEISLKAKDFLKIALYVAANERRSSIMNETFCTTVEKKHDFINQNKIDLMCNQNKTENIEKTGTKKKKNLFREIPTNLHNMTPNSVENIKSCEDLQHKHNKSFECLHTENNGNIIRRNKSIEILNPTKTQKMFTISPVQSNDRVDYFDESDCETDSECDTDSDDTSDSYENKLWSDTLRECLEFYDQFNKNQSNKFCFSNVDETKPKESLSV